MFKARPISDQAGIDFGTPGAAAVIYYRPRGGVAYEQDCKNQKQDVSFSHLRLPLYDGLPAICELRPLAAYFTTTALAVLMLKKTPTTTRIRIIQLFIAASPERFDLQLHQLHDRAAEV